MKTNNAVSKLSKAGFNVSVENPDGHISTITATKPGLRRFVSVVCQSGEVLSIKTVPTNDKADILTDYFPGSYWPSLKQAITIATA
jgi:hypothetical protein